ncbi:helix-hairpin-helix domain-containing protein [Corynebacterium alimapuense]|uniref:Competence protein ComEA n=1 Tax=Corynebacterium alimapuense TaxID=1576874 RepID=A0A3M8K9Z8_9CORY|nr:helix-hairpin-helix domain-containing protein [Corynebacterium alimapuense]RNE49625.1 competence protein ComEA [Corynebacterium alimapuense]
MSAAVDRLKDLTRPTGEEDLLDVAYPTPRFSLSLRHAVFATCLVAVLLGGWLVLRGDPADSSLPVADQALPALSSVSEVPAEPLVVSVVGEVARPGLITLPPGSRVDDALAVAGPLPGAQLASVNLAQLMIDGQQLLVPAQSAELGGAEDTLALDGSGNSLVSLNSASAAELMSLDGVGEKTAEEIISYRESSGGFSTLDQLMEVKGIGPAKFEAMVGRVSL